MTVELEVQVMMTLHMFHGNVCLLIIAINATNHILCIVAGPKSSDIRMMPKRSNEKTKMITKLKVDITKMVNRDRNFICQEPTLFYAKVCDFRLDLFRSSKLLDLPRTANHEKNGLEDSTPETAEEKLYRENNEKRARLRRLF